MNLLCKIVNRSDEKYSFKKSFKSSCLRVQTGMLSDRRNTPENKLENGQNVTILQRKKKKQWKENKDEQREKKEISYERVTLTKVY